MLDDFSLYDENAGGAWSSVPGDTPAGTTLTGLNDDTTYEYQVQYQFGGNTFYTPTATLSTLNADVAPTNLSATSITANTANISWKGFGDSYNLRYGKGGQAKVTLYVPSDIWQDDSGYQMLLDANHNTYGSVIPESGGLTNSGDASADTYANFEYKIPTNADGDLNTSYVVDGKNVTEVTITIPAGTYDWCITNPSPNDRVWIASENGNVGGRQNEFVFEAGKHYTFTVAFDDASENDCTNMTAVDDDALAPGDVTNVTGITSMSYALSDLTASTNYTVYVQSVKGDKTSEWSSVNFNTLNAGELYLYDDQDNSGIIAANNNQTLTVTLQSRTLYKDGDWNTLCLPFNVTLDGSPLAGAEARTLSSATLADGTLTLNFSEDLTAIETGKPYIVKWADAAALQIKTVDDWNAFAAAVAGGKSFAGKTVMLMDYVGSESDPITTMVGTTEHPFCGTFEGNCQRMYVNIDGESGEAVAPFRYINGATIQNLVIWGPVKGGNYSAGLVGKALGGTNSIHNVLVQTNVETSSDHVGGIIGHGSSSATTLRDCLFCGTILAPSSQHLGML